MMNNAVPAASTSAAPHDHPSLQRFLLTNIVLPKKLAERVEIVYNFDFDEYRAITADKCGRRRSRSAQMAELLIRAFFGPRVQKGKKWHPCGYKWLADFMDFTETDVKAALAYLKRKGVASVAKSQFSVKDPATGATRTSPAMWQLNERLIRTETRVLGEADEVSVMFEYADGHIAHIPLTELGDLDQPIVVANRGQNLLKLLLDEMEHQANARPSEDFEKLMSELAAAQEVTCLPVRGTRP